MISGEPITGFKEGFALIPFSGDKAHYWRVDKSSDIARISKGSRVNFWVASCGKYASTLSSVTPLDYGSYPKCNKCQNKEGK